MLHDATPSSIARHAGPAASTCNRTPMSIRIVSPTDAAGKGPRIIPDNRRTRHHLRELCDEVLASYRAAKSRELFAEGERDEARAILARIVPLAGH